MLFFENSKSFYVPQGVRCDGIVPSKNYHINYKLKNFEKQANITFKGKDILKGLAKFRQFAYEEFGMISDDDLIKHSRQVVVAWGTLSITNDIAYQNYIIETYGFDLFRMMQDFLRAFSPRSDSAGIPLRARF
jgi:hypothetical protein